MMGNAWGRVIRPLTLDRKGCGMKTLFFAGLACLGLLGGCAPMLASPSEEALSRARIERPGITFQDLQKGRKNYIAYCASCHTLHLPSEFTEEAWIRIMPKMQANARIDDATADSILTFVTAMTTKTP